MSAGDFASWFVLVLTVGLIAYEVIKHRRAMAKIRAAQDAWEADNERIAEMIRGCRKPKE